MTRERAFTVSFTADGPTAMQWLGRQQRGGAPDPDAAASLLVTVNLIGERELLVRLHSGDSDPGSALDAGEAVLRAALAPLGLAPARS